MKLLSFLLAPLDRQEFICELHYFITRNKISFSFFFIAEILLNLTKVNSVSRLRLLDYKGDLIYPSRIKLPVNTPDTAYYIQVLPETALNNNCK